METQTCDVRSRYSLLCQEINLEWLNSVLPEPYKDTCVQFLILFLSHYPAAPVRLSISQKQRVTRNNNKVFIV